MTNPHAFHIAVAVVLFATAVVLLGAGCAYWDRRRRGAFWALLIVAVAVALSGAYQVGFA